MVAHRFCPEQQTNLFSKFSDLPFTEEVVVYGFVYVIVEFKIPKR